MGLAPGASVGETNVWLSHHVKDKKIVADSIIFRVGDRTRILCPDQKKRKKSG